MPKEWKGVHYGGLERAVLFIDLDCRFDVVSISRALQRRIIDANGKFSVQEVFLFLFCKMRAYFDEKRLVRLDKLKFGKELIFVLDDV